MRRVASDHNSNRSSQSQQLSIKATLGGTWNENRTKRTNEQKKNGLNVCVSNLLNVEHAAIPAILCTAVVAVV